MGSKNKLKRFEENKTFANVIQPSREELLTNTFAYKGKWNELYFKNNNPIVLELGCGKGEYSVGLAPLQKRAPLISIPIKFFSGCRLAKTAVDEQIANVAFLRTQIELIEQCFAPEEVSEIWITFPDPQIKYKRTKHRLTNADFLARYQHILKPEGYIHLKTDSEFMHGYTLGLLHGAGHKVLYANHNIYNSDGVPTEVTEIKTFYEQFYLEQGKPITYIRFQLKRD